MERWRAEMDDALAGRFGDHPVWPAFHHTVRRFGIPHEYFHEMIDGVSSDLEPRRIETFDELYRYCYQVASVVGLTIIHIFGFDTPQRAAAGRKVRRRLSAHQYPARHPRRRRARAHLSSRRRTCAVSA